MLKNKKVNVNDKNYLINGLDAISSISLLPVFQRVANTFMSISKGENSDCSPIEIKEDLNYLFFEAGVLKEIYDKSKNNNDLARDVTHHTQLPEKIEDIGTLVQEIGSHVFGYELPESDNKKK